jgi:hypothetical protein
LELALLKKPRLGGVFVAEAGGYRRVLPMSASAVPRRCTFPRALAPMADETTSGYINKHLCG